MATLKKSKYILARSNSAPATMLDVKAVLYDIIEIEIPDGGTGVQYFDDLLDVDPSNKHDKYIVYFDDSIGKYALEAFPIPSPTADNDFLVGQATGNVWVKKTLAEVKTILGITTPSAYCVLTTTNQTGINNTASFIDITDLNFSADANSMYFIHWTILVTTTASNGFRVALTTPSGSSMEVVRSWYGTNTSNVMNSDDYMGASQFTNIGAYWVRFEGYVKTGATAGTVQGRIITNNVTNVLTVRAGSGGLVTKKS